MSLRHNNNHRAIRLHLIVRKYVLSAFKYAGNDQGRVLPSQLNTTTELWPMEKTHRGQKITGHRHDAPPPPTTHFLLPAADLDIVGRRLWLTGCNSVQKSTQTHAHTGVCWWDFAKDVKFYSRWFTLYWIPSLYMNKLWPLTFLFLHPRTWSNKMIIKDLIST